MEFYNQSLIVKQMQQVYGVDHVNPLFFKDATIKKQELIDNFKGGSAFDKNGGTNEEGNALYEQFFNGHKFFNPHDKNVGGRNGSLSQNPSANFYGPENVSFLTKDQQ